MQDKSLAYFDFGDLGQYALIPKVKADYHITPKHFLIRLSPKEVEKHRSELIEGGHMCTVTRTGARFCLLGSKKPKVEMEAMEMSLPSWRYSVILKTHKEPSLEEARKEYKNAFLVLSIKPEDFGQGEHVR